MRLEKFMGSNVRIIAFREPPSIDKLNSIEGMRAYRLFKHRHKPEWFIEGPSDCEGGITFHKPVRLEIFGQAGKTAETTLRILTTRLRESNASLESLWEEEIRQALVLSMMLDIDALLLVGDDEFSDAGFLCMCGRIVSGQMRAGMETIEFREDHLVRRPDQDGHMLYVVASAVASEFFHTDRPWPISSDSFDIDQTDYVLISSLGESERFSLPGDEIRSALWEIQLAAFSNTEKLCRSLSFIEEPIQNALNPRLVRAYRTQVTTAESQMAACALHFGRHQEHPSKSDVALEVFLDKVFRHLRQLRPEPEFRRSLNHFAQDRRLSWEWRMLKFRLLLSNWF